MLLDILISPLTILAKGAFGSKDLFISLYSSIHWDPLFLLLEKQYFFFSLLFFILNSRF
jgi:hypothetical protein